MNYFDTCTTQDECKALYRKYYTSNCKDAATMAEINKQLKIALDAIAAPAPAPIPAPIPAPANEDDDEDEETPEETPEEKMFKIHAAANFAKTLAGVDVEILGTWVWLSGETKRHRVEIKANGFRYHAQKEKWYYTRDKRRKFRRSVPYGAIQAKYGRNEPQEQEF